MTKPDVQSLLRAGIVAAKAARQEQAGGETVPSSPVGVSPGRSSLRQQARQFLLQVVKLDPVNVTAWLWLSTVVEDPAQQRACLEKALEIDPDNKSAQAGLARLGRPAAPAPAGAAPVKLKRLSSRPGPAPQLTPAHTGQNACPFCHKPASPTATVCPHCACRLVINCPACQERVDVESAACLACGQELADFRQGAGYFASLAAAYQAHRRPQQALEAWQAVEILQPGYPHLYLRLGEIQAQIGRTDTAISTLQRAMAEKGDRQEAGLSLGQIYQQLHRWDEAAALYTQLLAQSPQAAEIHYQLGWLLLQQGQVKEAQPYFHKVTQLAPQHGLAWLRLAQIYELTEQRRQATQAYRRAASLLPADTLKGQRIQQRLEQLRPTLPQALAASWPEFFRQMAGPVTICVLADLLDAGLRPWWIPWTGWLALILAVVGAFLVISARSLPQNPLICLLVGDSGLVSSSFRLPVALIGLVFWLLALSLILLPLGQSLPEVPPCPC